MLWLLTVVLATGAGEARVALQGVPELQGALTLEAHVDNRFDDLFEDGSQLRVPGNFIGGQLGYRRYLTPHGELGVGGHVGAGHTVATWLGPGEAPFLRLDVGLAGHARWMNHEFFFATLAPFLEVGVLQRTGPTPASDLLEPGQDPRLGMRWAAGLDIGFGGLTYLSPFIYTESVTRAAIETVVYEGVEVTSLQVALVFRFDFAHK